MTMNETTTLVELVCETPGGREVAFGPYATEAEARAVRAELERAIGDGRCTAFVGTRLRVAGA
jgi:hypothetical protein